jgi:phytoene dehydrogenase-like protein
MKTLVVGAGGGGISSALLSAIRGENVHLYESHSALGGCASWFKRGRFVFDAGATTLSGIGVGEPLGELFELLGHAPHLYHSNPGIVFHLSSGKKVHYFNDFNKWMDELYKHFPHLNHRPFWEKIYSINKKSWALLRNVRTFPFTQMSDVLPVLKNPEYASLIPFLGISTEQMLRKYGLFDNDFVELVNGILLISAQAPAEKIPFIVGAMALSYPKETFAIYGGMKGLMDFFEGELLKRGVNIHFRKKIKSFSDQRIELTDNERVSFDRLILNIPAWNLAELSVGKLKESFTKESIKRPGSWGAFTIYFGVKSSEKNLYHQIHLNHPLIKNYFVSFSIPEDELRAPLGYQSVSISTHVFAEEKIDREELCKIIMDDFSKRFHFEEIKFLTTGTPKTFERYTNRKNGFVGGLPFLYGKNPQSLLSPVTPFREIFRVGDTVFPGQGLCGVVAGALQLHHRLV